MKTEQLQHLLGQTILKDVLDTNIEPVLKAEYTEDGPVDFEVYYNQEGLLWYYCTYMQENPKLITNDDLFELLDHIVCNSPIDLPILKITPSNLTEMDLVA